MRLVPSLVAALSVVAAALIASPAHADVTPRIDLVGSGLGTFTTAYAGQPSMVESALVAVRSACDLGAGRCHLSTSGAEVFLLPVAGPAMLAWHETDPHNQAFLLSLSGAQAAGLAVAGYALATGAGGSGPGSVSVVPYAAPGGGGATLSGQF